MLMRGAGFGVLGVAVFLAFVAATGSPGAVIPWRFPIGFAIIGATYILCDVLRQRKRGSNESN